MVFVVLGGVILNDEVDALSETYDHTYSQQKVTVIRNESVERTGDNVSDDTDAHTSNVSRTTGGVRLNKWQRNSIDAIERRNLACKQIASRR